MRHLKEKCWKLDTYRGPDSKRPFTTIKVQAKTKQLAIVKWSEVCRDRYYGDDFYHDLEYTIKRCSKRKKR